MTPSNSFEEPPRSPNFSPPSIRSLLVRLANSENLERGEEKLEREERDTLDQSTSTGIRASKTPICDHEISEQVRDDRAPRDRWGAPARRLCRGNCAEAVYVKMNCVKMNCAKRLYRDSRIKYGMGCKPLRTAQTPPVSRAGFDTGCKPLRTAQTPPVSRARFDTGCKPSRATRPLPRSARSRSAISELNQIGAV